MMLLRYYVALTFIAVSFLGHCQIEPNVSKHNVSFSVAAFDIPHHFVDANILIGNRISYQRNLEKISLYGRINYDRSHNLSTGGQPLTAQNLRLDFFDEIRASFGIRKYFFEKHFLVPYLEADLFSGRYSHYSYSESYFYQDFKNQNLIIEKKRLGIVNGIGLAGGFKLDISKYVFLDFQLSTRYFYDQYRNLNRVGRGIFNIEPDKSEFGIAGSAINVAIGCQF